MKLRKSGLVKRPLCLEHLERRAMLAGDVTVWEDGGTLFVRGDNRDNAIGIVELDDGSFAVVGLSSDGSPTEVNNGAFDVFDDVERIHVDLRRGDDTLGVGNDVAGLEAIATAQSENLDDPTEIGTIEATTGATVSADLMELEWLFVQLADGNDEAAITVATEQRIHAELGKGNNELVIFDSLVGDDIIVNAGKNIDEVSITNTLVAQMVDVSLGDGANSIGVIDGLVGESIVIDSGKHGDFIDVADVGVADDVVIHSGSGHDEVFVHSHAEVSTMQVGGVVIVHTGSGHDLAEVEADVGENLEVITGAGNDTVSVVALVGHLLKVDTGNNNDAATVTATAEVALIFLGSGNDDATIDVIVDDDFVLEGGSGNDDVIATVDAGGAVIANMGSGRDTLDITIAAGFDYVGLHGGSGFDELTTNVDEGDDDVDINGFEVEIFV